MAVKKLAFCFTLLSVLILFPAPHVRALDAGSMLVEHVDADMPEITVRFQLNDGSLSNTAAAVGDLSATLDGKPLTVDSVENYDGGTLYMFLVDVSASISQAQTDAVKQALTDFRARLRPQDRMALISFGEEVNILLHGSESQADADDMINSLTRTDQSTRFYDAISAALSIADNKTAGMPDRCVAFVISDGLDDTEGGGHTSSEIAGRLKQSELPIWALAFTKVKPTDAEKTALDDFGELARESGGQFAAVTPNNLKSNLSAFDNYLQGAQVAHLLTENNIVDYREHMLELRVNQNGATITARVPVTPTTWIPDNVPPSVLQGPEQNGDYTIRLVFSKPLSGADVKDNYIVTDSEGVAIPLQSVVYDPGTDSSEITFDGQPYTGDYQLRFNGITDVSMEKNPLTGEYDFSFDGKSIPVIPPRSLASIIFVDFWWVVLLVALLAGAAIIWAVIYHTLKKRRGLVKVDGKISFGDAVELKYHLKTPESKHASLTVTDMAGVTKKIDLDIYASFFVGRSEQCNNLSFDDGKMSRQHFVIEAGEDGFFLTDLQTTNGTYLNGVKIGNKRRMEENDIIVAGQEKFVFTSNV